MTTPAEAQAIADKVEREGYALCWVEKWKRVVCFRRDEKVQPALATHTRVVDFTVAELFAAYASNPTPPWAMIIEAKLQGSKVVRA